MKKGKFKEGDFGKARRASLGEVEGSMSCVSGRKGSSERSAELNSFTSSLSKPEMGKEVGRQRARS